MDTMSGYPLRSLQELQPFASSMAVDPHATLTVPIGPKPVTMAAQTPEPKMAATEQHLSGKLNADYAKDAQKPTGFGGKLLHDLGLVGESVAPHLMSRIPGTELHREAEESNLENRLGTLGKEESEENLQGAQAKKAEADIPFEQAQTENLMHPPSTPIETSGGYYSFNPRSGETAPINGANGQPLQPFVKPGPRQHVFLQGPNGQPVAATFDPQSGTYFDAHDTPIQNPQPYEKAPAETPHPINIDGKPGFGVVVPGKGWVDPTTGQAITGKVTPIPPPPSYGQLILPTKTATFIDPKTGLPTEMQWNEKTQTYDKPLGTSASNAYGHEAAQAGAVDRAAQDLIANVQANRQNLGNTEAIVRSAILGTPWADPKTAELRAQIASFAALQPSMHGFRGTDALKEFEHLVGGIPNNPDALIAAINGIQRTAGAINPNLPHPGAQPTQGGPKAGDVVDGYRFKGGDPAQQSSWEQVKK